MSSLSYVRLLCIAVSLVMSVGQANGQWYRKFGTQKFAFYTITVDLSGGGNFTRIQSAIDAVPSNNSYWVCIRIKAGVYREKIIIPHDKPNMILKGEGRKKTHVVWDDHATVAQSPTFTSMADNIVVKSISFTNAYNRPPNKNPRLPAAAALIIGDQAKFCRCGFYGVQDTLWDFQGRHYYKLCTIQGAVDFIFGAGQSIFERCSISVLGGALEPGYIGFVTAQGRTSPNDANGFVFKDCHVFGSGSAFLGRPWRGYARVLFYNTNISDVIVPQGWDAWHLVGQEHQLTFAEEGCFGSGSSTSRRVSWEKKLSKESVKQLTSLSFIDNEGWLENQPF